MIEAGVSSNKNYVQLFTILYTIGEKKASINNSRRVKQQGGKTCLRYYLKMLI